jgi:hypothetical protein
MFPTFWFWTQRFGLDRHRLLVARHGLGVLPLVLKHICHVVVAGSHIPVVWTQRFDLDRHHLFEKVHGQFKLSEVVPAQGRERV